MALPDGPCGAANQSSDLADREWSAQRADVGAIDRQSVGILELRAMLRVALP
jgi:hypothetical protein